MKQIWWVKCLYRDVYRYDCGAFASLEAIEDYYGVDLSHEKRYKSVQSIFDPTKNKSRDESEFTAELWDVAGS